MVKKKSPQFAIVSSGEDCGCKTERKGLKDCSIDLDICNTELEKYKKSNISKDAQIGREQSYETKSTCDFQFIRLGNLGNFKKKEQQNLVAEIDKENKDCIRIPEKEDLMFIEQQQRNRSDKIGRVNSIMFVVDKGIQRYKQIKEEQFRKSQKEEAKKKNKEEKKKKKKIETEAKKTTP